MTEDISEMPDSQHAETLIDPDKQIFVVRSVPLRKENVFADDKTAREIDVPNKPHIFVVDELNVRDNSHPVLTALRDIVVIIAHAYRTSEGWVFTNGQKVVETVLAYNEWAGKNNERPIQFVIACSQELGNENPNIKVGAFDARHNIAYAVGEEIKVDGYVMNKDKKTTIQVEAKGNFFGLDELISSNTIQQNIKLSE